MESQLTSWQEVIYVQIMGELDGNNLLNNCRRNVLCSAAVEIKHYNSGAKGILSHGGRQLPPTIGHVYSLPSPAENHSSSLFSSLCDTNDQYAFHTTGSTTAALLKHNLEQEYNQCIHLIALNFSKVLDTIRHASPLKPRSSTW